MEEISFGEKVVRAALAIPHGRVISYGALARLAGGGPLAARSISSILARAEERGVKNIPWHRIVYANGRVWISPRTAKERKKRYAAEGIEIDKNGRIKNFGDVCLDAPRVYRRGSDAPLFVA
jgi:methylated-DNA-protein-cysteine methyltransferase related protein